MGEGAQGTCINRPENCPKVTVLICTLNEEKNLPYVLPKIPPWIDEVLVVDGDSPDLTLEVARALCPHVRIVSAPGNGKGNALRYGMEQAIGEIVVTLDADGSMDPEEIPSFVNPLCDGY